MSVNSGDDMAGFVHSLGSDVEASGEFRIGDRVAAMHRMLEPGGVYAEYAVAPAHTVFIIPKHTSFEGRSYSFSTRLLRNRLIASPQQKLQQYHS